MRCLQEAERIPEKVGAVAATVERVDLSEQRAVRARLRGTAARRTQAQQPARWSAHSLKFWCTRLHEGSHMC